MAARKPQLHIFMTPIDEAALSEKIRAAHPRVTFIDPATWAINPVPVARDSIEACAATFVLVLDQDLLTLDDYAARFFRRHPSGVGYSGAVGGPGLMQFGRCRNPVYDKGSLEVESVGAGYDSADAAMDRYVKSVMGIVKKGGLKVHYLDPASGAVLDKPMPGYWAWPDAAKRYDGTDGHCLRPDGINRMVAR